MAVTKFYLKVSYASCSALFSLGPPHRQSVLVAHVRVFAFFIPTVCAVIATETHRDLADKENQNTAINRVAVASNGKLAETKESLASAIAKIESLEKRNHELCAMINREVGNKNRANAQMNRALKEKTELNGKLATALAKIESLQKE
jgi:hypothetical protein